MDYAIEGLALGDLAIESIIREGGVVGRLNQRAGGWGRENLGGDGGGHARRQQNESRGGHGGCIPEIERLQKLTRI
jgi:hypothetical protein